RYPRTAPRWLPARDSDALWPTRVTSSGTFSSPGPTTRSPHPSPQSTPAQQSSRWRRSSEVWTWKRYWAASSESSASASEAPRRRAEFASTAEYQRPATSDQLPDTQLPVSSSQLPKLYRRDDG